MKQRIVYGALASVCLMAAAGPASRPGDGNAIKLEARLTGFQEVPSKLTDAAGRFTAVIDPGRTMIEFTLTFADLSTPTLFAHIHFAQRRVNGGIMVFLCNNSPDGPQPRPCPSPGGTVTGTIRAEDVVGPGLSAGAADQGITPGSLDDALRAILNGNGATYANVHSERFPGGEIRGQIAIDTTGGKDGK
jgi:CHRD domain